MQFFIGFVIGIAACAISVVKVEQDYMRKAYRQGYWKGMEDSRLEVESDENTARRGENIEK